MRKITFVLSLLAVLFAQAQYTGPGYYRVRNAKTKCYMSIKGTVFYWSTNPDAFWSCVLMQNDPNQVSDPGSIIYIPGMDETSLYSQGVSTYSLTGMTLNVDTAKVNEGGKPTYIATTFYNGLTYLFRDYGLGFTAGTIEMKESRWWIEPVSMESIETSYFGLNPVNAAVQSDDAEYWATLCCDFPCLIPEGGGIEGAYTVTQVYYAEDSIARVKPLKRYGQGDTIPAAMPVIIKCTSPDVADNKLVPTGEIANRTQMPITADLLTGNYFSNFINHISLSDKTIMGEYVPRQSSTACDSYLALGIDENGTIGFFPKEEGSRMDANTAWLDLSSKDMDDVKAVYFIANGDGNGDGKCDMNDLSLLINYMLEGVPSRTSCFEAGMDFDNNGVVDVDDMTKIINYLMEN